MSFHPEFLQKSLPDQWTVDPLTIRSTFIWSNAKSDAQLQTESCGFGWAFSVKVQGTEIVASFKFSPPTGNGAGRLRTSAVVKGRVVAKRAEHEETLLLGFCFSSWRAGNNVDDRIGTCAISGGGLGIAALTFVFDVVFSEGSPFASPISPSVISAKTKQALTRTVDSGELVDVKFFVFTAIRSNGDVCKPKPLYSSRTVMHQVSQFLDTRASSNLSPLKELSPMSFN